MDKDELYWGMYEEHANQARQHENQRERMTALVVALCAAILTFASKSISSTANLWLTVPLIPLGVFGAFFSRKHYERNRMHVAIAAAFAKAIDANIYKVRSGAEETHKSDPEYQRTYERRLHRYWEAVPWAVAVIGALASVAVLQAG